MPTKWKTGYIVIWESQRLPELERNPAFTSLELANKVYTGLILERIRNAVDAKLRKEHARFRKGRSCTDQIATLRNIIEQSLGWQSPLYVSFVDF